MPTMKLEVPRRLVVGAIAALLLSSAQQAAADPRSAREHLETGLALAEKGEWERALAHFEEAHHLDPQPTTLFDVAQARMKTGRYRAAIEAYQALLAAKSSLSEYQVNVARRQLATARQKVARLTVDRSALAESDEVTVDGQPVSRWPVLLDPGVHVARARRDGKVVAERSVELAEGANETIELRPSPTPAPATAPRPAQAAPPQATSASWPPWVVLGASAAVLGVGAFFGVRGYGAWSDLHDGCGRTKTCAQDDVDAARRDVIIGDVGIGLGVVGIAAGVYLLVSGSKDTRQVGTF